MYILKKIFILIQFSLPGHIISRFFGIISNSKNKIIKNSMIFIFLKLYKINLNAAFESNPFNYNSFNEFFTRKLKYDARPINKNNLKIISPVDGTITQVGFIEKSNIIQAKNHCYNVFNLLGGYDQFIDHNKFINGSFITIYLSPSDYHRVHMPFDGDLKRIMYIPGKLFSVNKYSTENITNIFARNERVVILCNTKYGNMALVMIGAIIVASINTIWTGLIKPPSRDKKKIVNYDYNGDKIQINKGEEIGYFMLGSTVILLFEHQNIIWKFNDKKLSDKIKMGEEIGRFLI